MDIPLILEQLRPGEDWGPCATSSNTYEELISKWRSKDSAYPTKAEMESKWLEIKAVQDQKKVVESETKDVISNLNAKPWDQWTYEDVRTATQILFARI